MPAETEKLIGELRALLIEKQIEIENPNDDDAIIRAAIAALRGTAKSKEDAENAEVAASLRTRLGVAPTAGKDELILKLSLLDTEGSQAREATAELAALKNQTAEQQAQGLVDRFVNEGRITPKMRSKSPARSLWHYAIRRDFSGSWELPTRWCPKGGLASRTRLRNAAMP